MAFSVGLDLGSLGAGAITGVAGLIQGQQNLNAERKNLEYQQNLQSTIFGREDTSVQRRVADLKAAGLSPVLAAGSGAGTGSVVATSAPRREGMESLGNAITTALAVKNAELTNANIDKAQEETALIKKQQLKADADTLQSISNAHRSDAEAYLTGLKARQQEMDNSIQKMTGLPSQPSAAGKVARDVTGAVLNLFGQSGAQESRTPKVDNQSMTVKYYKVPLTGQLVPYIDAK